MFKTRVISFILCACWSWHFVLVILIKPETTLFIWITRIKMAASIQEKLHMLEPSSDSDIDDEDDVSDDGFEADEEEIINDAKEEEDEEDEGTEGDENQEEQRHGLANVMTKILQRKIPANKVILAKALTDKQLEKKKLEAEEGGEGETKDESQDVKSGSLYRSQQEKLKEWENISRVKPDPLERNRERQLQKTATRGVVQLFNAVKKQQVVVKEEVEKVKTEKKKEQVMADMNKYKFLDILKGTSTSNVQLGPPSSKKPKTEIKEEKVDEDEQKWNVLRDDYMMGAKMKDWNKSSSEDDDSEPPDQDESDSD